jgi:hypothetical protein
MPQGETAYQQGCFLRFPNIPYAIRPCLKKPNIISARSASKSFITHGIFDVVGRLADTGSIQYFSPHIDGMTMGRVQKMDIEKLDDLDRQPQESVTPFHPKFVS